MTRSAFLVFLLAGARRKPGAERRIAPGFQLPTLQSQMVTLSELRGRVVLLNFWATWCGPCRQEIPWFMEFENTYGPQGLTVLGVAMDEEGAKVVAPYVARRNVNYAVLLGNEETARLYGGVKRLPVTVLIDRQGRIAFVSDGAVNRKQCQTEIEELLRES